MSFRTPGEAPIECFVKILLFHLNSRSALQRTVTGMVISAWPSDSKIPDCHPNGNSCPLGDLTSLKSHPIMMKRLIECLTEHVYFDEIAMGFSRLQRECQDFVATLRHYKVPLDGLLAASTTPNGGLYSFDQVQLLSGDGMVTHLQASVKRGKTQDTLLERRRIVFNVWSATTVEFSALNTM